MNIKKLYLGIKSKKIIIGVSMLAVILAVILCIHTLTKDNLPDFVLNNSKAIKLEYGEKYSVDSMKLLNTKGMDKEEKEILKKRVEIKSNFKYEDGKDYPAIGDYKITMTFNDEMLIKKVKVVDTTAPELTVPESVEIVQGTDLSAYDFKSLMMATDLAQLFDYTIDTAMINVNVPGEYSAKVSIEDASKNKTEKEFRVVVVAHVADPNVKITSEVQTDPVTGQKKTVVTTKPKQNTTTNSSSSSSSSNNSNTINSSGGVKQSFVANMSISNQTTQAITVVGNGGSYATLTLHTKQNGIWTENLSCSARVGKNGISSNKKEGDGKTPTGIYSFGQAFGIASNPGTSRNWLTVNSNHYWVDDINSSYYNRLVDASQTGIQWNSAEHLVSYPIAYKYAIAVNYNTACTPGAGSAIFLHCSTGGSTAGCISVSQSNMIQILRNLQNDALIGIYLNSNNLY